MRVPGVEAAGTYASFELACCFSFLSRSRPGRCFCFAGADVALVLSVSSFFPFHFETLNLSVGLVVVIWVICGRYLD